MATRRMKGCSKPMGRVVVMNIKPWLGWARNNPHKFYVNATVFLEKQHPGFTCIHLPISNTGWNICYCCMLIIYRLKQNGKSKVKGLIWVHVYQCPIPTKNEIWSTVFILTYLCISAVQPKNGVTFFNTSAFGFNFLKIFWLHNF